MAKPQQLVEDLDQLEWAPRRWRSHWLNCCGEWTCSDLGACCLALWLPYVAYGRNVSRVLGWSLWREMAKAFLLIGTVAWANWALSLTEAAHCDGAGKGAEDADAAIRAVAACKGAYEPAHLALNVVGLLTGLAWAVFVGGPARRMLRERLGITAADANGACCCPGVPVAVSDGLLHWCCTCCAIAQEARTVMLVERLAAEQRRQRGDDASGYQMLDAKVPLVEQGMARSAGGRAAPAGGELPV